MIEIVAVGAHMSGLPLNHELTREGGVLVTAFHPELTDDTRLHQLFVTMIRRREGAVPPGRAVAAPANH